MYYAKHALATAMNARFPENMCVQISRLSMLLRTVYPKLYRQSLQNFTRPRPHLNDIIHCAISISIAGTGWLVFADPVTYCRAGVQKGTQCPNFQKVAKGEQ